MKKIYLKTVAVMLTLCLLFGVVPLSAFAVGDTADTGYKVGDNIEFGSYPQSEVVDPAVIAKLDAEAEKTDWVSYEYYSGSGTFYDGKAAPSDYMQYKDFSCDGEKYRAVRFTKYRPNCAWLSPSADNTSQRDNFYFVGNTYYFKYEPLSWRVLDPSEGFIMCNSIVDSQAFLNFEYFDGRGCWYNDEEHTTFATDWVKSSLRKWLNEDFYNTAFTPQEKAQIGTSYIEHSGTGVSAYSYDRIFILSYEDVRNSSYGFNSDAESFDPARKLKGTDYARCQGLMNRQESEFSSWMTRSHYYSIDLITVTWSGGALGDCECTQTNTGVVPALKFKPKRSAENYLFFGSYPQKRELNSSVIEKIEAEAENVDWVSYGYYICTNRLGYKTTEQSDFMQYKDVSCDGEKYRMVRFNRYRTANNYDEYTRDDACDQYLNGYYTDKTYYFKFEPLRWKVIDPAEGFVVCENIIDSRPYNDLLFENRSKWYNNEDYSAFASDWETGSLRQWLNGEFYNMAFSDEEKAQIGISHLDNRSSYWQGYDGADTDDKIFILSYYDAKNADYGFESEDITLARTRQIAATDYAKCQGVTVSRDWDNVGFWWLRTPFKSDNAVFVDFDSRISSNRETSTTHCGVVPAFKFNPQAVELSVNYDLDGGEWASDYSVPTSYMSNEEFTPPSNDSVKKIGFDFLGWKQSPVKRGVTTLTAEWGVKDGYTVSFDCDGGTATADKTNVKWTDKVLDGVNYPEKDGYTFSCWKHGETQVGSDTTYADLARDDTLMNVTLKAVYSPNTYMATLLVDGEVYREIPYTYGQKTIELPEVPQKEGFAGEWESYSLGIGGVVINAIYTALPKNVKSVSIDDMSLKWKQTGQLAPKISADDGAVYTVSYSTSDPKIATVDKNGKVTAVDKGTATLTCTVTDSNGNTVTDTCKITVTYEWWQWIVKILLFGWIWY